MIITMAHGIDGDDDNDGLDFYSAASMEDASYNSFEVMGAKHDDTRYVDYMDKDTCEGEAIYEE